MKQITDAWLPMLLGSITPHEQASDLDLISYDRIAAGANVCEIKGTMLIDQEPVFHVQFEQVVAPSAERVAVQTALIELEPLKKWLAKRGHCAMKEVERSGNIALANRQFAKPLPIPKARLGDADAQGLHTPKAHKRARSPRTPTAGKRVRPPSTPNASKQPPLPTHGDSSRRKRSERQKVVKSTYYRKGPTSKSSDDSSASEDGQMEQLELTP